MPGNDAPATPVLPDPGSAFSRESIATMVQEFYEAARSDPLLGPVFEARIDDWGPHLERMTNFWCSILLGERSFVPRPAGGPVALHRQIPELGQGHFQRWLELFSETCRSVFPPGASEIVEARARNMAVALSAHLSP